MGGRNWLLAVVLAALITVCQSAYSCNGPVCGYCGDPVCEYFFTFERRPALVYYTGGETYNVGLDAGGKLYMIPSMFHPSGTVPALPYPLDPADVNTLAGEQRDIVTINGAHPGPVIDVKYGAQVVMHVTNKFFQDSMTVHMHGIHQLYNMWMDGVPFLTQCPIMADTSFTYRFIAAPVGTHWYHSHLAQQRMDGLQGMLIVHPADPPNNNYFIVAAQDLMFPDAVTHKADNPDTVFWSRGPGNFFMPEQDWTTSAAKNLDSIFPFYAIIVNGMGRLHPYDDQWPLETFVVDPGTPYRFYMVHTGQEAAMRVSIDGHLLTVVGSDEGDFTVGIEVESFIMYSGEGVDIEITAKATDALDRYWVRFSTIGVIDAYGNAVAPYEGRAILEYSTANSFGDPTTSPIVCTSASPCKVFNCAWEAYPTTAYRECIPMADGQGNIHLDRDDFGLDQAPDREIFLNFNDLFEHNVNGHAFAIPKAPLSQISQAGLVPCDPVDCNDIDGCICTYIIDIGLDEVVQMVFTDYEDYDFNGVLSTHPIHLHGNSFAVLKQGFAAIDPSTGHVIANNPDVMCSTPKCMHTKWSGAAPTNLNTLNPPIKDTVVIPPQGYTVVRFRAFNPGFWIMHCHLLRHSEEGMAVVLHVGTKLPHIPPNFPTCQPEFDFDSAAAFDHYLDVQESRLKN